MSVRRVSVAQVAERIGISQQALGKQCRVHGLATPKQLIDIATIYHVERLASWSGRPPDTIALEVGFRHQFGYSRLVQRVLGETSSEGLEAGGPDHVAREVLRRLERGGGA